MTTNHVIVTGQLQKFGNVNDGWMPRQETYSYCKDSAKTLSTHTFCWNLY
jgi:hypothetical protein